jgi:hypothetical protein
MTEPTTGAAPQVAATTSPEGGNLLASSSVQPSATTPQSNTVETTAPQQDQTKGFWVKPDGSFADNWQANLPEDLKAEKSLQSFKDINGVMRTLAHQARMVGADKIALPGKDAKPEDWGKVYDKLGRPPSPDKYDLKDIQKLPESAPYDYNGEKEFLKDFHELGLSQAQAKGLLSKYREKIGGQLQTYEQTQAVQREEALATLKKDFGQAFDQKVNKARLYVESVAGDNAAEIINKYGNDPAFIRFAVDASKSMQEDSVTVGQSTGIDRALSPAEAQAEINDIREEASKDRNHPLNGNTNHPKYKDIQARWSKLHGWLGR